MLTANYIVNSNEYTYIFIHIHTYIHEYTYNIIYINVIDVLLLL